MLQVDPKMVDRLDDLEQGLLARRARAEAERWLGEIEGIDLTLAFLRGKRDEARLHAHRQVNLGLSALRAAPR